MENKNVYYLFPVYLLFLDLIYTDQYVHIYRVLYNHRFIASFLSEYFLFLSHVYVPFLDLISTDHYVHFFFIE